jgi:hypothetical protein
MNRFTSIQRTAGLLLLLGCAGARGGPRSEAGSTVKSIDQVLEAHRDELMALPGVTGVAIGLCGTERCITVLVRDSATIRKTGIPRQLEGYQVRTEVSGLIKPR